ncbi:hypothetical protein RRG08_018038 [Elysia crispata]|uniref:Uncharacterized protein n=1 Tax=Elysia crispata TaxID=231223 RepID=A0AAE0ZD40_9GAST|nr:hypothetical protein RRG08_018038 [Elysia crispata]
MIPINGLLLELEKMESILNNHGSLDDSLIIDIFPHETAQQEQDLTVLQHRTRGDERTISKGVFLCSRLLTSTLCLVKMSVRKLHKTLSSHLWTDTILCVSDAYIFLLCRLASGPEMKDMTAASMAGGVV